MFKYGYDYTILRLDKSNVYFEIRVINSINLVFNQVTIQGYFFHLSVCMLINTKCWIIQNV